MTSNGPVDDSSALADLARAALQRLPELAEQLLILIRKEDPDYARGDLIDVSELRRSFRDNLGHILIALTDAPENIELHFRAPRTTGRIRADLGFPLESVLHTYRLGNEVLWEALLDEARRHPPAVLNHLVDNAARLFQLIDRFSMAMVDSYRQREADRQRHDAQRRRSLLDALLDGRGSDPSVLAQAAAVLDLPASGRFAIVVSMVDEPVPATYRSPQDVLAMNGIRSEWSVRADREIGVVKLGHTTLQQLIDVLPRLGAQHVGVSGEAVNLADLGTAYQLAELALRTLPAGAPGVGVLDERLPESLLVSSPTLAERLARQTFGRVLALDAGERDALLCTLEAWFESDRSAARAAEVLFCHRNTVLNRLNRIQTLSGLSLEDDRSYLACRLALAAIRTLPVILTAAEIAAAPLPR